MKPNRCLFSPLQTKPTHPPDPAPESNPKQNQKKHTHTHRGTRAPKTHTLTSPSTPALPLRLNRKQTNTRQDDPTSCYTLLSTTINPHSYLFFPFHLAFSSLPFSSLLSSSLSPHLLLLCLLPSSPTKNQKEMKKNSNKIHSRQQHDAARQLLIANNPSPKQTSSSCSASSTHPARLRGLKQHMA